MILPIDDGRDSISLEVDGLNVGIGNGKVEWREKSCFFRAD